MKWNPDSRELVLSSGRRFPANDGILGIGPNADDGPAEGYDRRINLWDESIGDDRPFSAEEKREIAAAMVARWIAWAGADMKTPDPTARTWTEPEIRAAFLATLRGSGEQWFGQGDDGDGDTESVLDNFVAKLKAGGT